MEEFYPFFVIIFVSVFFSMVFRRIHAPWVIGLIAGGILMGPQVFGVISVTPLLDFIAQIGLTFLMFMAGLESRFENFKGFGGKVFGLALINGIVPFFVGFGVTLLFGYSYLAAFFVGIVFISSSIAVVVPSLERYGFIKTKLGQSVVVTSVIQDIGSLLLLSIALQSIAPATSLPLLVFYPLVIGVLVALFFLLPLLHKFFTWGVANTDDFFQQEFRVTFLMLIGTVVVFELLGLHPIIAGFFSGLVLSRSITSPVFRDKIHAVSYGVFIPAFFILVGVQTDVLNFLSVPEAIILTIVIIIGSVVSKFVSGWFGARLVGFTKDQSLLFAVSSIPQLSTTLAVVFAAHSLGVIDSNLVTGMVALSVATVFVSPVLLNIFSARIKKSIT